jgi:hypothetical protein
MNEELETPNSGRIEPQPKEMKHYLELLSEHGVDFEASDLEHLEPMDDIELTEYFLQALLEAGVEDPESFMIEHALVEGFSSLNAEQLTARNSRELRGVGHKVDDLDSLDDTNEGNT